MLSELSLRQDMLYLCRGPPHQQQRTAGEQASLLHSKTRRQVSTDISLRKASGETRRVGRLAASSSPPLHPHSSRSTRPLTAATGWARHLEGNRAPSSLRHDPVPVGGVVCRGSRVAQRARSVPHVKKKKKKKKNVRTDPRPQCWVRACEWRGLPKSYFTGYGREARASAVHPFIWRTGCHQGTYPE